MPIHPAHLIRLPEHIRKQLYFEKGFGKPFQVTDEEILELTAGIASRDEILTDISAAIIAKPILADLEQIKEGGLIWGSPHCAQ